MSLFSQKYFKDKEEEQDFFISLVVILFFGAGIFFFAIPAITSVNEEPNEEIVVNDNAKAEAADLELEKKEVNDIGAYVETLKEKEIENTSILPPKKKQDLVINEEAGDAKPFKKDEAQTLEQIDTEVIPEEEEAHRSTNSEVDQQKQSAQINQNISASPATIKNCRVLIGAFKNDLNAEVLKQRLEDDGYEVYEEARGKFNIVGIMASCDPIELENALLIMRSHYSPDAFVPLD